MNIDIQKKLLNDINCKYKPIDKQTELCLIIEAQNGSKSAIEQLLHSNLLLIYKISLSFVRKYNADINEAFNLGSLGFIRAIELFDTNKYRNRLYIFAQHHVRAHINNFFKNDCIVRMAHAKDVYGLDSEILPTCIAIQNLYPEPSYEAEQESENKYLHEILQYLSVYEQDLIKDCYGIDTNKHTLNTLCEKYDKSQSRIQNDIRKIILKLRKIAKES